MCSSDLTAVSELAGVGVAGGVVAVGSGDGGIGFIADAVSSDDLWAIEEAEAQQSCDDRVIKLQFEPSPKELELIRKAIYDELNQLVSVNHPLIAQLHDGQEQWLCISAARVASQEVPVSVQHIALLLKHQTSVVGLRVSKNEKGSTVLSFARA